MEVTLAFISPSRVKTSFAYTANSNDGEGTGIICGTLTLTALRSWNLFNTERYSAAWAIHCSLCRTQRFWYISVALFPGVRRCISLTSSLSQDSLWTKDTEKSNPEHLTHLHNVLIVKQLSLPVGQDCREFLTMNEIQLIQNVLWPACHLLLARTALQVLCDNEIPPAHIQNPPDGVVQPTRPQIIAETTAVGLRAH